MDIRGMIQENRQKPRLAQKPLMAVRLALPGLAETRFAKTRLTKTPIAVPQIPSPWGETVGVRVNKVIDGAESGKIIAA
jgi:hypothetical protein